MKKAVILLSGGLDSTTCLAYAHNQGFDCYALSFDYGQRHIAELNVAKLIASHFNAKHTIFKLKMIQFGASALTDNQLEVPDYDENNSSIPITYVPARNTVFLSIALALAESLNAKDIFIGVSAIDYSGYPDCRPEYIQAFQMIHMHEPRWRFYGRKQGKLWGKLFSHTFSFIAECHELLICMCAANMLHNHTFVVGILNNLYCRCTRCGAHSSNNKVSSHKGRRISLSTVFCIK